MEGSSHCPSVVVAASSAISVFAKISASSSYTDQTPPNDPVDLSSEIPHQYHSNMNRSTGPSITMEWSPPWLYIFTLRPSLHIYINILYIYIYIYIYISHILYITLLSCYLYPLTHFIILSLSILSIPEHHVWREYLVNMLHIEDYMFQFFHLRNRLSLHPSSPLPPYLYLSVSHSFSSIFISFCLLISWHPASP